MPDDNKPQEVSATLVLQEQNPVADKFGIPILNRDQFLDLYTKFQRDLYREDISEENLSEKINSSYDIANGKKVLISLYRVNNIRFRDPGDIMNALRLYYQAASRLSFPIVYMLKKRQGYVCLYLGCYYEPKSEDMAAKYASVVKVFPSILSGFLPGTECDPIISGDGSFMQAGLDFNNLRQTYKYRRIVFGVPGEQQPRNGQSKEQAKKNQGDDSHGNLQFGIERVLDAVDEDFMLIGYSEPVSNENILQNQAIFSAAHDLFHLLAKRSEQISKSYSEGTNWTKSETKGITCTEEGTSETTTYGDNVGKSLMKMFHRWCHGGEFSRRSVTVNKPGDGSTEQVSAGHGGNTSVTEGKNASFERTNELARQTEEILSRQLKRLEKGLASGMWRHTTQVLANQSLTAERVANLLCGYWGGNDLTVAQVRNVKISDDLTLRLPLIKILPADAAVVDSPFGIDYSGISTLLTSEELAIVAGMPLHEVPGIVSEKLTDYGRNFQPSAEAKSVPIGEVIDYEVKTSRKVSINFEQLKRHMFVTGATGAGKSTTMRQLLLNLNHTGIPFLVIEPVKREYRELKKHIPELQVITLGVEDCHISLNPFNVEKELGLVPHIDNLKAAFNATMGNYSSMPFILEDMIYRVYTDCGWDLETGTNALIDKMAATGFPAHTIPIMSDLLPLVATSINFFFPNQSDYGNSLLGALRARISSMTRGAKGNVLDSTSNPISMEELLKKPCVIELWPFTDNEEKAFIMALLMIKLYEYRQSLDLRENSDGQKDRPLEHVLVIEEAHRLLSKPQGGNELSSNGKQKAVEFFADILAEIRSYGQSIVVVDQIPSKLISDVLKNTDVKIAHRLADKEDRDVLGGTMNLSSEQMKDIARLRPGEAVVYYGGLRQAIKIKVPIVGEVAQLQQKKNGGFHARR
ncbi:MAG: ATP-binding protein [Lentisphaerae bacterium]|jgi:hypothetical protein|nr:ATP-binding protein [Lentisphaerota bacterium]